MRILAEETMVLVVDIQEKLIPVIKDYEEVIESTTIFLKGLKALNVPIKITQQYTKGLGATIKEVTEAAETEDYLEKITFSAYETEDIRKTIDSLGKENIILCGTEAHVCVLQTLIDLREADYQVILISDCIGSRKEKDKEAAIHRALFEGAIVTTYEQILFELTRKAGTPTFKKVISLVK